MTRPGPAVVWMRPLSRSSPARRCLRCSGCSPASTRRPAPRPRWTRRVELHEHRADRARRTAARRGVGLPDAETTLGAGSVGLAASEVYDERGLVARSAQALLVTPRALRQDVIPFWSPGQPTRMTSVLSPGSARTAVLPRARRRPRSGGGRSPGRGQLYADRQTLRGLPIGSEIAGSPVAFCSGVNDDPLQDAVHHRLVGLRRGRASRARAWSATAWGEHHVVVGEDPSWSAGASGSAG